MIKEREKEKIKTSHVLTPYKNKWIRIEDEFSGVLTSVYIRKGVAFCVINDSVYCKLNSKNYLYEQPNVSRIIQSGDSIRKEKYSELYFLKHKGETYMFHISKTITKDGKLLGPLYYGPFDKMIHEELLKEL